MSGRIGAYVMLIICVVTAGVSYPVTKYALQYLPPFFIAFFRYSVATIVFLPLLRRSAHVFRDDLPSVIGLGLSGAFCFICFMNVGMRFTTGVSGSFLSGTSPLMTALLAAYFLGEAITARKCAGLLIGFFGVAFIVGVPVAADFSSLRMFWGNLAVLCSLLSWAVYTIIGRRLAAKYKGGELAAWTILTGAILLFPLTLAERTWEKTYIVNAGSVMALLFLLFFNTIVAYFSWNYALRFVSASTVSSFQYIQPLSGAIVSILFLKERVSVPLLIGAGLVLLGVYQVMRAEAGSLAPASRGGSDFA